VTTGGGGATRWSDHHDEKAGHWFCWSNGSMDATTDFLRRHCALDVVVWTDGSVPSLLGAGGASVQAACRRCLSSSSVS